MSWTVEQGDCVEQMQVMDEASIDAVVCDPPYHLTFMGRTWDHAPTPAESQKMHHAWATEALRVLKPGGHLLAFGGTRTYHRLACAVEDAGFEIRDSLIWLYGSGFPKSLDVSKAIDRRREDNTDWKRVGVWLKQYREAAGHTRQSIAPLLTEHKNLDSAAANMSNWENGLGFPTLARWAELKALLNLPDDMDAEVWRLNGRKGKPGENWEKREKVGEKALTKMNPYAFEDGHAGKVDLTAPATPEAEKWQGWGTAFAPSHEPIVVARKPLIGTVASNVLQWGTGAINIDGCRTGSGRWPKNCTLSHLPECEEDACGESCPVAELDRQSGERPASFRPARTGTAEERTAMSGPMGNDGVPFGHHDAGGASRFFYVAKASRAERNAGLGEFSSTKRADEGYGSIQKPKLDRAAPRENWEPHVTQNGHPTVKPIDLMRWLVRLVTPPGGTCLDPFTGSGTTGIACVLEDFDFIGIEREAEYVEIAKARIAHWASQPKQLELT